MFSGNPLAIIILGATASGKTALSLNLAAHYGTSIISADSRQCFREMNIGTAKPTKEELAQVRHYFINTHSISDHVDASVFEHYALEQSELIFKDTPFAVVTGGTGLYIKAFCEGMDEMPAIDPEIRNLVTKKYKDEGISSLQHWLLEVDPLFMNESGERNNPSRLMRALEVSLQTGKSIMEYRKGISKKRPFRISKIGIQWPRELLYERINNRVDQMMMGGLLSEVESLLPFKNVPALQTVGYQELIDCLEGKMTYDTAVEKIKQHTRNYAKRQLTWFKKDTDIQWFSYDRLEEVIPYIDSISKI